MRKIFLIISLLMLTLMSGCNSEGKDQYINNNNPMTQDENIKVSIESDTILFYNEEVTFTPIIDGDLDKEVQYHWILQDDSGDKDIYGFVSTEGLSYNIINSGEAVKFAQYAEVSYVDDAYSEIKVILQIEEKDTNNIIGKDELTIINRAGVYFVKASKAEDLQDEILKSEKSRVYAEIFDIVWETDKGLNSNVKYINVDTSTFENFSEEDKVQLFDYLAKKYNAAIMDKNFQELEGEGYIKNLTFIDGINFKVNEYIKNTENEISFEGTKWASGLGAIGFTTKAEKVNGIWKIKKCSMTWIS
ncbi:hypothetical protein A500_03626 [Clostridium sartagoforme AAU1]|uniref:Lipoprotein n=1 Tax=Clostridium sartagoforme AAU1 TaxID=1202534 RepID=R9CKF0_9CLOT|nr:hypothetical protein [Clostridium sartagoforme]EOR27656.1 hypothetical protein A500_03626 [Clostridium sartagoforme AAU1]